MHSTLRTELRGTQRVFELLRPRPASQSTNKTRRFSHQTCLHSEENHATSAGEQATEQRKTSKLTLSELAGSKAAQLGLELERWINHLSRNGESLHVWDTISQKDDSGRWRLLPNVRRDLGSIGAWVTEDERRKSKGFGLKVAKGKIRALALEELQREGETAGLDTRLRHIRVKTQEDSKNQDVEHQEAQDPPASKQNTDAVATRSQETDTVSHTEKATGGDTPPKELGSGNAPKFYGSSAARRQRAQRARERSTIYLLPGWFRDRNVLLWGDRTSELMLSEHAMSIYGNQSQGDKIALVLPQSDLAGETAPGIMKEPTVEESVNPSEEKVQAYASGGSNKPEDEDNGSVDGSAATPKRSPILVPLPDSNKRYFIEEAQLNELIMTARGKLRLPAFGSPSKRPSSIRGHLIIHHTAPDSEIYLDKLVEDVARRLQCDLVTLDAQDITALISGAELDPMLSDEARTLSYDIYSEIYKDDTTEQDEQSSALDEEIDDGDEDSPNSMPQGMPFAVGKPIMIDLKALFGPKGSRRQSSPFTPKGFMSDMMNAGDSAKPSPHMFAGIVDSVLSSAKSKRQDASSTQAEPSDQLQSTEAVESETQPKNTTIIHVKELKAIQFTNVGKQFLGQIYEQVERRRSAGEAIMIVGTESSHKEDASYDNTRIRSLQDPNPDELSTTMVITPANPNGSTDTLEKSLLDRAHRISVINARHLWETLQSKDLTIGTFKPGFWTGDFLEKITESDREYLAKGLWPFSHVQRLAAIMASEDFSKSKFPIAEAASTIELSDKSKFLWAKHARQETTKEAEKDAHTEKDKLAKIREKATKHEKKLLGGVIEPKKMSTTFKDIHIPPETVDALQTLTTLSLVRPDAFKYGVLASDRIPGLLLYGPPGTGKTLAAKAVARESGATMLEVSAADINDMYVGEGEKNVKALFSLAKKLSPCVVFLDEADAMFSARSAQGRRVSHRELLNQFLREWDGMSNDSGSAFIMVATNRPMDLDDAVLRRLPRRLLVDLPTEIDRLEILKIHLRHEVLAEDVNLSQLATKTPFYSGSDLKNVAVAAALNAVREENELAKSHPSDSETPFVYPNKRTLTATHFEKALEEISASISEDMASLREIKRFDEVYGDRKGRKRKSPRWGFTTREEADRVLDTVKVRS